MKRELEPFILDDITLRLIEFKDLPITLAWRNRDDARFWFKSSKIITAHSHLEWFINYRSSDSDFLFVVEKNGQLVGQASVYKINWPEASAEVGRFLVSPAHKGKGYISKACEALLIICKECLYLKYVYLEVMQENITALSIYKRNRFIEESKINNILRLGRNLSDTL